MKKIVLFLVLLISLKGFSQPIVPRSNSSITVMDSRISAQYNLFLPRFLDTVAANLSTPNNIGLDTCGAVIFTYTQGICVRFCSPKRWVVINSGGGSGIVSANNGLTLSGSTVQLGGTLIQNTSVAGGSFTYSMSATGASIGMSNAKIGMAADSINLITTGNGAQFFMKPTLSYFGAGNVGIGTATPGSLLTTTTNGIGTTQSDAYGVLIENTTAAANGAQQTSPPLVLSGNAWRTNSGGSSRNTRWRLDVLPVQAALAPTSILQFSHSNDAGVTYNIYEEHRPGSITLWSSKTNTIYGQVNGLTIGSSVSGIFVGSQFSNILTSSGVLNTAIGISALNGITTGNYNTAVGASALSQNKTGTLNTAVGLGALQADTSGSINTAIGNNSLNALTNGYSNTGVGVNSMLVATTGFQNAFLGAGTAEALTTGQENTGVGYDAGLNATTAIRNVWLGWNAKSGTDGYQNEMIGYTAGASLTAGNHDNIGIGFQSMFNASQLVNVTNSIAIGTNSYTTKSNLAVFGASTITETWLRGNVGINTESPAYKLDVLSADAGVFAANIYNNNSATGSAGLGVRVNHSGTGHIFEVLSGSGGTTPRFDVLGNGAVFFNNSAGTSGQVLTSAGNASPPTWETSSSGGITIGTTTITSGTTQRLLYNNAGVVGEISVGSSGSFLRSNGTSWGGSTLILPNAATATYVPYATSTNTYGESANMTYNGTTFSLNGAIPGTAQTKIISVNDGVTSDFSNGAHFNSNVATARETITMSNSASGDWVNNYFIMGNHGASYASNFYFTNISGKSSDAGYTAIINGGSEINGMMVGTSTNDALYLGTNNSYRIAIAGGGGVTLTDLAGTGSRAVLADATGLLSAPVSDRSTKQNINDLRGAIGKIMKLRPVTFEYRDGFKNYGSGTQVGFIAQDIQKVLPNSVYTNFSNNKMGYREEDIIPLLVSGMQAQQKMIEELQKEIKKLKHK